MNKDFEILENVEINGKEFIIYFDYNGYNNTMEIVYDIYNQHLENYITNKFKCEIVIDKAHQNLDFVYDEDDEIMDISDKYYNSICGYYFLFNSKEEMKKCVDHLNSFKIAWELGEY